jgi:hypothetical protein
VNHVGIRYQVSGIRYQVSEKQERPSALRHPASLTPET